VRKKGEYVGHAFQVLLADLPIELVNFTGFAGLPEVDAETKQRLEQTPSVQAAPEAMRITRYGLTPFTFLHAPQAVSDVILRYAEENGLSNSKVIVIDPKGEMQRSDQPSVEVDILQDDISLVVECDLQVSARILDWLIAAGQRKPHLFPQFKAE